MSTWTNEFDVFRDLDRLSGLKHSNVTYPALNAFGRGKLVIKEDQNGRRTKVAQFSPPPKIPVTQSCPEVEVASDAEDDSTWDRDRDLFLQLREVCGRGYSNELIEEEFRQTENHSQEQFNDTCLLDVEDILEEESNKIIVSDLDHDTLTLNKSTTPQLKAPDTELVSSDTKHSGPRLFVHPPKLKPGRNALLNSLARMKILQLSEEPEVIGSPINCQESDSGHITEDSISSDNCVADTKLSGTECLNGDSHCATGNELETPNVDLQKLDTLDQTQPFQEVQKQCINWSDIRKLKLSRFSPVSMNSSNGSSVSPVRAGSAYTSQFSRQENKVKSYAATSILDLPGFSASPNFSFEESDTLDWKQDDRRKQDSSHRASSVQSNSKTKRTKEYRCSLPSSPINSVTPNEKPSWSSIRQHNSNPKNIMLSDYIEPICSLGSESTHNSCELSFPEQGELRNSNSLQINSVKDFPPLE